MINDKKKSMIGHYQHRIAATTTKCVVHVLRKVTEKLKVIENEVKLNLNNIQTTRIT